MNTLESLLSDEFDKSRRLELILRARQSKFCERSEAYVNIIICSILNGDLALHSQQRMKSILDAFCQALDTSLYTFMAQHPYPEHYSLSQVRKRFLPFITTMDTEGASANLALSGKIFDKCAQTVEVVRKEQERSLKEWVSELDPWDAMVEKLRSIWGEQWIFSHLANIAGGINTSREIYQDFSDLLDHSKSLCKRICYARSRTGTPDWWKKQFSTPTTQLDYMFVSLVFLTWGSPTTIISLSEIVDPVFSRLPLAEWRHVIRSMREIAPTARKHSRDGVLSVDVSGLPENLSERTLAAIGMRAKREQAQSLYLKHLSNYQGSDSTVLEFCLETALDLANTNLDYWQQALAIIVRNYANGTIVDTHAFRSLIRDSDLRAFPSEIAKQITDSPQKYPRQLVSFAETKNREVVASKIVPVGKIAQEEGWFVQE